MARYVLAVCTERDKLTVGRIWCLRLSGRSAIRKGKNDEDIGSYVGLDGLGGLSKHHEFRLGKYYARRV